jgi:hypothetical protein
MEGTSMNLEISWTKLRQEKKDGAIACIFFFGVMVYSLLFVDSWKFFAWTAFAFLGACIIREYLEMHPMHDESESRKIEVA